MDIKRSFCSKLLLVAFALLCFGTLFAISDSLVDTRMLPKWYVFFGTVPLILFILAIPNFKKTGNITDSWSLDLLFLILVTSCFTQAIYGILQFADLLPSHGSNHRVTGSFENPAGFAACLCAGLPFAFYFWNARQKFIRHYTIAVIAIVSVAVVFSFSRTGILNLIILASIATLSRIQIKHKAKIVTALVLLLLAISAALYSVKKDSADGRLLIWRCSIEMIKDKPILGHGSNGFTANYMNYQAEYFKQHPDSKYAALADTIHHPFNEYILLLVNYGLVGFVLFVALLYWIWSVYRRRYRDNLAVRIAGWSLCSVLLFSLFSYPLSYPFVWVVVLMNLVIIARDKLISNHIVGILLIVTSAIVFILTCNDLSSRLRWKEISRQAEEGHTAEVLAEYSNLLNKFGHNRYFLYNYAYELQNIGLYSESLAIANRCSEVWADYYLQLMIADNYYKLGQYDESIQHFKQAAAMCPVRFMPLYRLTKLYLERGQTEQAQALARQIMNKEVKIPSPTINAIKYEMRQYLEQQEEELK